VPRFWFEASQIQSDFTVPSPLMKVNQAIAPLPVGLFCPLSLLPE
jgi:hypothetical protein